MTMRTAGISFGAGGGGGGVVRLAAEHGAAAARDVFLYDGLLDGFFVAEKRHCGDFAGLMWGLGCIGL
jgi:hypothetical protein